MLILKVRVLLIFSNELAEDGLIIIKIKCARVIYVVINLRLVCRIAYVRIKNVCMLLI